MNISEKDGAVLCFITGLGFIVSSFKLYYSKEGDKRSLTLITAIFVLSILTASSTTTKAATFTGLGDLPGGDFTSYARGISADGSTVVGYSKSASGFEAFRWTLDGGMAGLGDLQGSDFYSYANAVSGDGSVVVGCSSFGFISEPGAFRWTSDEGMVYMGNLPGDRMSVAQNVSDDGSTIVGSSNSRAFRWTSDEGMVALDSPVGNSVMAEARALSADGSVIVGAGKFTSELEAIIWDEIYGMRSLKDMLVGSGLDLAGWTLTDAWDISADGLTVVGYGINPDGNEEGWVATVPEPCSLILLGLGGLILRRREI